MTIGIQSIKLGQRVLLLPPHPWAGHAGEFVREEYIETLGIIRPVVKLDSGQECFVMNPLHWQRVETA